MYTNIIHFMFIFAKKYTERRGVYFCNTIHLYIRMILQMKNKVTWLKACH